MRFGRGARHPSLLAPGLCCLALAASLGACSSDDPTPPAAQPTASTAAPGRPSTTATSAPNRPVFDAFDELPALVRAVSPSVVAILTDVGEGSGVVWDEEGRIVTNHHVVAGATRVEVAFADGKRVPAALVATDELVDLAVLDTDRDGTPAATFATELPEVGSFAMAVGNPLGFENSVSAGIVSGLHRQIPGSAVVSPSLVDLIQTDAAISPGNSGGALVGPTGEVIGVNVAYIPPQGGAVSLGFAVPAPTVTTVVPQLITTGRAEHAYLGISPAPITPEVAARFDLPVDRGVLVLEVEPSTPAAAAGLRPGDVVTAIAEEEVTTVEDLLAVIARRRPGDVVSVHIHREGRELDVEARLADRPS